MQATIIKKHFVAAIILLLFASPSAETTNEQNKKDLKQLIFEERRIEGKIRRPQLVLIKAEQRPDFEPMVLQSLGKTANIAGSVEKKILEESPYDAAFMFRKKRIINYVP